MAQTTSESWQRLEEIFRQVVLSPPEERGACIERSCQGDEELCARIVRMIEAHEQESSMLDASAVDLLPLPADDRRIASTLVGRRIGKYQLTRLIASGGMGTVYEAQQDHPRRIVALKVMHGGVVSRSALRRFEVEADILGRLNHPAIAHVHEAGMSESDEGVQPFFAMEFIDGLPITDHARQRNLGTRERLSLLLKVCEGVQHAHINSVIHRDLKPANILVDSSGQPKILDFGVARATAVDIQTATLRTDMGQLMGTVAYMSPEQVTGDPSRIDPQSDVYALGVIGYELLADRLPYNLDRCSIADALEIVRGGDPIPLSSVDKVFRGELGIIIGKALEKDKALRYATAADLGADIKRYLCDEPVMARRPSTLYQLRKFAQRNRTLVGGVCAVIAALTIGVIGTTIGLLRAQDAAAKQESMRRIAEEAEADLRVRLSEVLNLTQNLITVSGNDLPDMPGATAMRDRLAATAVERLQQIGPLPDDRLYATVAMYAYQRMGEVQAVTGRCAEALKSFETSMTFRRQYAELEEDWRQPQCQRTLGVGHWKIAEALMLLGRLDEAQEHNRESLRIHEQINEPGVSEHYVGAAYRRIAEIETMIGQHASAIENYRQSLSWFERGISAAPDNLPTHQGRAMALRGLGETLVATGEPAEAMTAFSQSLIIIAELAKQSGSANVWDRTNRARTLLAMAPLHSSLGENDHAVTLAQDAVVLAEGLAEADPVNFESRYLLARSLATLARAQSAAGLVEEGTVIRHQATELLDALAKHDPDNALVRRDLESIRETTDASRD